jgi:glycosyltransferase involved in cell wall biosynthesis
MRERLAAVIPAFDAAPSVGDVARRTLEQLDHVLVVDDGSTDDTAAQARETGAEVVRHEVNRGKGTALRTAFNHLFGQGFNAVLTLDADGQHLPEEIPKMVAGWQDGGDLVLGGREHLFAKMSKLRQRSNGISSGLISWVAGQPVGDVQTGFRIYTRELIAATGFPESRFEAESAVVVRAARKGFRIVTVPIELGFADGRCTSHYRPIVDSVRIARAVIGARIRG